MTSLSSRGPAFDRVHVSLDLETTGLDPNTDHIIEVGAIKFRDSQVLDTLETFVNPYAPVPEFVQRLTGISPKALETALPFAVVAGRLAAFVGSLPVIGHNVAFDLQFLSKHGLPLNNPSYDTWDLASVLLPRVNEYSLSFLAGILGIEHPNPHRALSDAQITHQVFVELLKRLEDLDPGIRAYIRYMADRARWSLRDLLDVKERGGAAVGLGGFDREALAARLVKVGGLRRRKKVQQVDEQDVTTLASPHGLLSQVFPAFEHRPQQVEMMAAVTRAINHGSHLIVEGGTGVGKSLAYLLPSILFAVRNGTRVVVSTNTINLQEQLLQKDIPALVTALENGGQIPVGEFRATALKGRANYLCVRRWSNLSKSESLSREEAHLLSKCLIWLQDTSTGDRGEINLGWREEGLWRRISAGDNGRCPGLREGSCFLRAAREQAEAAHIIVVNHALLLSDLARGGTLIPDYQYLIIDEAQHLEKEATQQLGFQVSQKQLLERLDDLPRWVVEVRILLQSTLFTTPQRREVEDLLDNVETFIPRLKDAWARLWAVAEEFLWNHQEEGTDRLQLRITRSARVQPGWSQLEIAWENGDVALSEAQARVERLYSYLDLIPADGLIDLETLTSNLAIWLENVGELRDHLQTLIGGSVQEERIDWMSQDDDSTLLFHSAPLNVGDRLGKELFGRKECVILTSATLSTEGSFNYIRQRLGLSEGDELLVDSPFDYSRAALLALPDDIPEPRQRGYNEALESGLVGLIKAGQGHTMVLFTSHAALRGARQALVKKLEPEGIKVLAQGVDGPPHRILRSFIEHPESVLLGTSSFWEGVDLPNGVLKVLALARLPFHVPTEPTFAARSEQYEDPFDQYAVPQAVLRFRQGFGRLIRSSHDRGVVVVLDRRILNKAYGSSFLDSIPSCTIKRGPMSVIPGHISQWLQR